MGNPNYYIPEEDHLIENGNILLIDSEKKSRLVVNTILHNSGFDMRVAKSGADATKLMLDTNHNFGFILINIKEGIRASRLMRNCGFKNPIIYYTEANVREQKGLIRFPDIQCIYPISTSNNTWGVKNK